MSEVSLRRQNRNVDFGFAVGDPLELFSRDFHFVGVMIEAREFWVTLDENFKSLLIKRSLIEKRRARRKTVFRRFNENGERKNELVEMQIPAGRIWIN